MEFKIKKKKGVISKETRDFFEKPDFQRLKVLAVVLLLVSFFLLNISPLSVKVKSFFYSVSAPMQSWLWEKGSFSADFLRRVFKMQEVLRENERLQEQSREINLQLIELSKLKQENELLRTALSLGLEKEFQLKLARITAKDVSGDYLIIDKGFSEGLDFGFPIITGQKVLVGKIVEIYENSSKVKLSTSQGCSFDAEILGKEIYGLAEGQGNSKLSLGLISREENLEVSDKVITSALGGNFPEGLLVGEVENIKKTDITTFQEAELKAAFNVQELRTLFIITNFLSEK